MTADKHRERRYEQRRFDSAFVAAVSDRGSRVRSDDGYWLDIERGVYAVVDAMGGHGAGVAAASAVEAALAESQPFTTPASALRMADIAVRRLQATLGPCPTDLTLIQVAGVEARVAHVGQTRAYHWSRDQVKQITEDDVVSYHVPFRYARARGLGMGDALLLHEYLISLSVGDRIILCSDGVWRFVSNDELASACAAESPGAACDTLIEAARENGSDDVMTAVTLTVMASPR